MYILIEWLEYIFFQTYTICESQEWLSYIEYLDLNLRGRLIVVPRVALSQRALRGRAKVRLTGALS